jgi:hypothetical protein
LLGDDVGQVGVEVPPTLDWLREDTSEGDDKAASMLVSIDPEVDIRSTARILFRFTFLRSTESSGCDGCNIISVVEVFEFLLAASVKNPTSMSVTTITRSTPIREHRQVVTQFSLQRTVNSM